MHAIKKAARRSAWYNEDDEKTLIPNPFGRMSNRPRRIPDEENNTLSHTMSEGPGAEEERRRQSYQQERRDFTGPAKSGTFPEGPANNLPRSSPSVSPIEGSNDSSGMEQETSFGGAPQKTEAGFVDSSVGANEGPRKRKMRKFMPWKKSEESGAAQNDADLDRADTAKKNQPKITVMSQVKVVLLSWINLLLVFVPAGIALGNVSGINGVIKFVINFVAIIPLAGMLSFATEELAMYIGETLGGLLNASFGNAVELIVGIIALVKGEILIVQTSLIGSMLSNLLLVLGMCFFFGGLRRTEQFFNLTVAQTAASLLALAIGSLIIPTAFGMFAKNNVGVAPVSRGTSVLLLVTYACYLIFQLRTHVDMYNEPSQKSPKKPSKRAGKEAGEASRGIAAIGAGTGAASAGGLINKENLMTTKPQREINNNNDDTSDPASPNDDSGPKIPGAPGTEDDADENAPQLTVMGALVTLCASTVFVALCAEYMVTGIKAVSASVSQEFIGLILLPIVGNAAEHATAVTVAIKDKMDLAIGVAIGSSLQIALLVLPIMVCLNWFGVGNVAPDYKPLTLDFDGFLVSVLFISIILVNYLIQDGKSHWLEGALLQVTYLIIAVSAWFYPAKGEVAG